MWSKLSDELLDHKKIHDAGDAVGGPVGSALAFAMYTMSLVWCNKHLSDGLVPLSVVRRWTAYFPQPLKVAKALVEVNLWEEDPKRDGFQIHDWFDHNIPAELVLERREKERDRKRKGGRHSHGANGRA